MTPRPTLAAYRERQANALRLASEGARRAMAAATKPRTSPLTDAQRVAYADTEVCRVHGHRPSHWRHDQDGLVLVMEPARSQGAG